jgi:hypothetical protein
MYHYTCFRLFVQGSILFFLSIDGRKGGQASSEDLLPLGYGERERIKVRVRRGMVPLTLALSRQGGENKGVVVTHVSPAYR